jgi:hypothetical protein
LSPSLACVFKTEIHDKLSKNTSLNIINFIVQQHACNLHYTHTHKYTHAHPRIHTCTYTSYTRMHAHPHAIHTSMHKLGQEVAGDERMNQLPDQTPKRSVPTQSFSTASTYASLWTTKSPQKPKYPSSG